MGCACGLGSCLACLPCRSRAVRVGTIPQSFQLPHRKRQSAGVFPRFPRFRVFTWIILAINVLFLIWIIGGTSSAADNCDGEVGDALSACEAGTAIGAGIGAAMIIGLWVAVDIILGIIWLITRPKTRDCPVCGDYVKRGQTRCKKCGHDFAQ